MYKLLGRFFQRVQTSFKLHGTSVGKSQNAFKISSIGQAELNPGLPTS